MRELGEGQKWSTSYDAAWSRRKCRRPIGRSRPDPLSVSGLEWDARRKPAEGVEEMEVEVGEMEGEEDVSTVKM